MALKWKDIDFEEHTINVNKTYYNTKNFQLIPPKKGSIRKIEVEEVNNTLKKHQLPQKEIKLQLGKDYYDKDFVFGRLNAPYFGYPHFIKTIENRMESLLKKTPDIHKKTIKPSFIKADTHFSFSRQELNYFISWIDWDIKKMKQLHKFIFTLLKTEKRSFPKVHRTNEKPPL
ncbi:hypothetical protein NSS71_24105 [Niallia sp. FSL W8-0951]|uniref:hypothetical protein n=1 Tax=Niallia TaxID=2837506 RepID=UPI0030FCC346